MKDFENMRIEANRHLYPGRVALLTGDSGTVLCTGRTEGEAYRALIQCVIRSAIAHSHLSEREILDAARAVFP